MAGEPGCLSARRGISAPRGNFRILDCTGSPFLDTYALSCAKSSLMNECIGLVASVDLQRCASIVG